MRWRLELAIVVVALFIVALFFAPRQGMLSITGFFSTETQHQQVNLELVQSSSFLLRSTANAPLSLMHFSVSGSVAGKGAVQVFLKDGEEKVLVYTNIHRKKQGLTGITGQFVNAPKPEGEQTSRLEILEAGALQETPAVPEGYDTAEESFKDSCSESCALPAGFYNKESYTLEVLVAPGAILDIDEINYIVAKE